MWLSFTILKIPREKFDNLNTKEVLTKILGMFCLNWSAREENFIVFVCLKYTKW